MRVTGLLIGCGIVIVALAVALTFSLRQRNAPNPRAYNPPPKAPNCASVVIPSGIRLAGEQVADVRIIAIGDTKLYVPRGWLNYYFIDRQPAPSYEYGLLEQFRPDLHSNECPGVVHHLVLEGATPESGTNRGSVTDFALWGKFAPTVIGGSGGGTTGFSVGIQATLTPDGVVRPVPRASSVGEYWIRPTEDFFILKTGPVNEKYRADYQKELSRLATWLMQTPASRDNQTEFFPAVDFGRKK